MHAVLISVNWKTQDVRWTFITGEESENPLEDVKRLKRGIEKDWPDHEHFVFGDEEAREKAVAPRLAMLARGLGGEGL